MTRPDDIEPWAMEAARACTKGLISAGSLSINEVNVLIARALMAAKAEQREADANTLRGMALSKKNLGFGYQDNDPQKLALFAEASALFEGSIAIRDGSA